MKTATEKLAQFDAAAAPLEAFIAEHCAVSGQPMHLSLKEAMTHVVLVRKLLVASMTTGEYQRHVGSAVRKAATP